ncbi:HET-domain-containing protein [Hyaloscypha hepaticicola]|uniref:HET-domain-containing protein n=1 Tax=Hyaloscypha hepaticicola TaxID=2082293 RepID=A0A2J6PX80_9HELO|nr:HET-domain-containing protein [Hyaloscypha hepaticicola]
MRLLEYNNDGGFSLTEYFESNIPKYAILSHRWGPEEVTFKDLLDGTSKNKAGYSKVRFCGEQARGDDLQYFWVDTCCIDKSNAVELQEAINSMFRWYQDATKCYVYLQDVSRPRSDSADGSNDPGNRHFRKAIDFFSKEGKLLGNKASLERHICERTGIPINALRGSPLSDFSVLERMSWAASRETSRQEDKAYSLFGIFNVFLPIIYGEGLENAFQRLQEAVDKKVNGVISVPDPKFASRGKVRQEKTHFLETQRRVTSFGNSGTFRGRPGLKCYRCDNRHRLKDCYANLDTVSKARNRRMNSNRCVNCRSEEH